jgi:crotonobetainyl-CoA:carnitine CoA-transferase CaiB-like acyl-CoA transferase
MARAALPVLARARARVSGSGATAQLLRWHLEALGAEVEHAGPGPAGAAAAARLDTSDSRRQLVVEWAGPVAGVVDETTAQALCGVMHVHGRRDGRPRGLGVDYCSTAAAVLGVTGLVASLLDDRPDAEVRTSAAEAALLAVSQYLAAAGAEDPEAVSLEPGGGPFTSADGVVFEIESLRPEPWAQFWTRAGADRSAFARSWQPFQFRYATGTAPMDRGLWANAARWTFAELRAIAEESGVDMARVRTGEPAPSRRPLPWTLRQRGTEPRKIPGDPGAPLRGAQVLEAGRRVQAPLAARVLDLLGATTTRIEPPGGDPMRGMPPSCGGTSARWLALNRGKGAVELDIKSARDRAELVRRAEDADVFLHNWAPGKADSLGLGARDLPDHLVYVHASALGGHDVPDPPLGTDFMVQARSGLGEQIRPRGDAPEPSLMTVLDVLGGLLAAESTVAALLHRSSSGGAEVDSGLFGAASALRLPLLEAGITRRPAGFREPRRSDGGWIAHPDGGGEPVAVTDDFAGLVDDPRFTSVLTRDELGCPAVRAPWRFS